MSPRSGASLWATTSSTPARSGSTVDFDALFHSLDWLQSLDVDYIIPGHGPVKGKECIWGEQAVPVRLAGCRGRGHRKGLE